MPHVRPSRAVLVGVAVALAVAVLAGPAPVGASTPVVPVPGLPDSTFTGHAAVAHPVRGVPRTPQNPHLAPNGAPDWVVYHTGSSPTDQGTVKKVQLSVLDHHPDPRWRPVESNKNFLGFYRLKILQ